MGGWFGTAVIVGMYGLPLFWLALCLYERYVRWPKDPLTRIIDRGENAKHVAFFGSLLVTSAAMHAGLVHGLGGLAIWLGSMFVIWACFAPHRAQGAAP
jgi:hypothetical protein